MNAKVEEYFIQLAKDRKKSIFIWKLVLSVILVLGLGVGAFAVPYQLPALTILLNIFAKIWGYACGTIGLGVTLFLIWADEVKDVK